jgi:hypothetical protein
MAYTGTFQRLFEALKTKGRSIINREQLSFIGAWAMFIIMSLSSFKLPHYLNILIPLFAIFTASWLHECAETGKEKLLKVFKGIQTGIIIILVLLGAVMFGWVFPLDKAWIYIVFGVLLVTSILWYRNARPTLAEQTWIPSAITILLINFLLNTHFYPSLDQYQGGSSMAKYIKEKKYPLDDLYLYDKVYRTFDFYLGAWRPMLTNTEITYKLDEGKTVMLFTNEEGKAKLEGKFNYTVEHALPDYHITLLDGKFLNPATRSGTYGNVYLLKVMKK